MKKIIVSIIFLFLMAPFVRADDANKLKVSEFTVNAGKGAFVEGLDFTVIFEGEKSSIELTANHQRSYGVYFLHMPLKVKVLHLSLKVKVRTGICGGVFKNMPQAGPYIIVSPVKVLDVFYWRGWGFGEPENPRAEFNNFFEAVGVSLMLGNLKLSYVYSIFMNEKTALPGICYSVPINQNFKFFAGCDYKDVSKEMLFRIGVSYKAELIK